MKYCLDTSTVIEIFKDNYKIVQRVGSINRKDIYLTLITVGELEVGYAYDQRVAGKQKRQRFFKFVNTIGGIWYPDDRTATEYGRIKAKLKKSNLLIGDNDTWIAAICKVNKATLVTVNKEHFSRVEGLKLL